MGEERALSVSEVVGRAKRALEGVRGRVVGEVSELTDKPGYKAVYFSIRDDDATLSCLAWRDVYAASDVTLEVGTLVELGGYMTVYPPKGRMQFIVRTLALAGEGALRMRVAALARKLEAEGLMAPGRKRSLPEIPENIGVVTSPRGKAVHDVIRTLARRHPVAKLVIAGVRVEGASAEAAIVAGLEALAVRGDVDTVILCRGGGSYEDLMPFNSEAVARAVATTPVPVVTGIGHEPDTTIADMVADVRCSTPTAAAEAVAPTMQELDAGLVHTGSRMAAALARVAAESRHRLTALAHRPCLSEPESIFAAQAQHLDLAAQRLEAVAGRSTAGDREALERGARRLLTAGPPLSARRGEAVEALAARLEALSPQAVLDRGYAMAFDGQDRVIRDAETLSVGDPLSVRFSRGVAACEFEGIDEEAPASVGEDVPGSGHAAGEE